MSYKVNKLQTPAIPKDVADFIAYKKIKDVNIVYAIECISEKVHNKETDDTYTKIYRWIVNNENDFIKAWTIGFRVVVPEYVVKFMEDDKGNWDILGQGNDFKTKVLTVPENNVNVEGYKTKFTMSELANINDKYTFLAEQVDERIVDTDSGEGTLREDLNIDSQAVKVPYDVAEFLNKYIPTCSIYKLFDMANYFTEEYNIRTREYDTGEWILRHQETFVKAYLYGYEVQEEKE